METGAGRVPSLPALSYEAIMTDHLPGDQAAEIARRRTRSDWMGIERERGISVVTSVMTLRARLLRLQPARHARPRRDVAIPGQKGAFISSAGSIYLDGCARHRSGRLETCNPYS
jgi:hypothetical protein